MAAAPESVLAAAQQPVALTPAKAAAAIPALPAATLKSVIADAVALGAAKSVPIDGTESIGPIESAVVGAMAAIDRIDTAIYGTLDAAAKWLSGLPVTPFTECLQGTLLLVRRTLFDQAPTVTPVQLTGQVSGPITGTLGAVDPESEAITYSVVEAPLEGTVTVNPDGTYTYTPGPNFDGSDVFVIEADDNTGKGPQGNVLEPRRLPGTDALVGVKQGTLPTIKFDFSRFKDNAKAVWTAPTNAKALTALEWTANQLANNFDPQYSVTLNYELGLADGGLASAGSNPINLKDPGFWMTVVQDKIINGTNTTNATVDGQINMNFDYQWSYFGQAGPNEYSFQSTMGHEVLHSFGFLSWVGKPPKCNVVYCNVDSEPITPETAKVLWFDYDKFIGNSQGKVAVDNTTKLWNSNFDKYVTGAPKDGPKDGLYFLGTSAKKAFGGEPVPLYSPNPYESGSSVSHLNDYYFNNYNNPAAQDYVKLMNAAGKPGEPNLPLSKVEKAMLEDLGYTMKA